VIRICFRDAHFLEGKYPVILPGSQLKTAIMAVDKKLLWEAHFLKEKYPISPTDSQSKTAFMA